jgi:hypothetical protein
LGSRHRSRRRRTRTRRDHVVAGVACGGLERALGRHCGLVEVASDALDERREERALCHDRGDGVGSDQEGDRQDHGWDHENERHTGSDADGDQAGLTRARRPADTGSIRFASGNTAFADGDIVTATLRVAPRTLTISFEKATETLSLVLSDETTGGLYRLSKAPPPSPLLATGVTTDLMPLATTFRGTIDFASAVDAQARPVKSRADVCAPMSFSVHTTGDVDVDIDGVGVAFPYGPRRSTITQFDDAGTEVTQLSSQARDGQRVSLEVLRPTGSLGAFTLKAFSVQVVEGEGVVAEYTERPVESPCP